MYFEPNDGNRSPAGSKARREMDLFIDARKFLSGFVVCTSQIPTGDREAIFGGVEACGGQWQTELKNDVTHLITLKPTGAMYEEAMRRGIAVLLPHYFDDCFRLGRKCREHMYSFPDPKILSLNPNDLISSKLTAGSLRRSSPNFEADPQFLRQHVFFLGDDLPISPSDKQLAVKQLESCGAKVAKRLSKDVTCAVLGKRAGTTYYQAETKNIVVGSIRWLRDILKSRDFTSPKLHALHYPAPANPAPGMETLVIALTNYVSPAREDIEEMVLQLGAKFSRSMSQENTHLICCLPVGEKYARATQWNLHIVNHLWIEECYIRWSRQSEAKPHYVHFPPGLGDIVGDVSLPWEEVNKWVAAAYSDAGHQEVSAPPPRSTNIIAEQPTAAHETEAGPLKPCSSSKPAMSKKSGTVAESSPAALDEVTAAAVVVANPHIPATGVGKKAPASTAKSRRSSPPAIPPTETSSPQVETSTSSASKAKPKKPRGRPRTDASEAKVATKRPRESSDNEVGPVKTVKQGNEVEIVVDDQGPSARKKRKVAAPTTPSSPKILLFTGLKLTPADNKGIGSLRGQIATQVRDCTHLIAEKVARTEKFLAALSLGKHIVHKKWLDASVAAGEWQDEQSFPLVDEEMEGRFEFSLSESIARARRKKVLEEYTVYATPLVSPDGDIMARIVEAAGGNFLRKLPQRAVKEMLSDKSPSKINTDKLIVVTVPEASTYHPSFLEAGIRLYSSEFLLTGILRQKMPFGDSKYFLS
ncbi:hypothetical protein HK097_008733 [Rhizophlyctis rosea]|uniref:BRCT domain-containing protein n=1 Tax=Rhizophlyctis rosea TaxID=64517 RepID=A0AAD5SIR2_9FUNG|nr:hypothetical protein HK097_008733 [Rhizophlyctis rosea]